MFQERLPQIFNFFLSSTGGHWEGGRGKNATSKTEVGGGEGHYLKLWMGVWGSWNPHSDLDQNLQFPFTPFQIWPLIPCPLNFWSGILKTIHQFKARVSCPIPDKMGSKTIPLGAYHDNLPTGIKSDIHVAHIREHPKGELSYYKTKGSQICLNIK